MRYFLILALALVISALVSSDATAEPEVYMVELAPDTVDNQQEEDVSFNSDCSVCNGEGLTYFYWNSSIDGVLASGSEGHNVVLSSAEFSTGEHTITFQVRDNNSEWSVESDSSSTILTVSGRDDGGSDTITVNFGIDPPTLHIGETATFRACSEMYPEPQPCVDDPDADLDFNWEVLWNNEGSWSYIGNSEMFTFTDLQQGTHTVKLSITYQGDTANDTQEMIVLPPIPQMSIDFTDGDSIKEGEILEINAQCFDNNQDEIECEYYWEVWDNDGNPDLLFTLTGSLISVSNLTNSMGSYEILFRSQDNEHGIYSSYYQVIVNVLPPNEIPLALISISPESLGGLTPEYYQFSMLTFTSSSVDSDGNIVSFNWYDSSNVLLSTEAQFSSTFNETGIYQMKLEVEDDSGAWSSKTSTNFKIITNTAPSVDFAYSFDGGMYTFNSSASDLEGFISSYQWSINGMEYSNGENITWTANKTGTYTIALEVTDDGGMKSTISKDIDVKIVEMKNFAALFSSKDIEVGGNFEIDFSQTTGDFDYFEIKVLYPNGTSMKYTVKDNSANFSITFDRAGSYPIDVKVIWIDGVDRGLDDFYGPTVNVGQEGSSSEGENGAKETSTESSDDLPSLSLLVSVLLLSIIAVSRRQR
ncbi:PKD domain-containing protein [Marine Group III euryarchaeote]|nr:PKD domain-containing protein [Marine Group III euryarchaeote]